MTHALFFIIFLYVPVWNKLTRLNHRESFFAHVYECRSQIINYSFTNDMLRICHPRRRCTREHLAFFLSEISRTYPYPNVVHIQLPHLTYLTSSSYNASHSSNVLYKYLYFVLLNPNMEREKRKFTKLWNI